MLFSSTLPHWGRVYFPPGAGLQTRALLAEIPEYFHPSIQLARGDIVFDVGANVGAFALGAAMRSGGGLTFHCFEPISTIHAALAKNFRTNRLLEDSRSRLHRYGLTAPGRARSATFHHFRRLPCDTTQHIDAKRREFARYFASLGTTTRSRLQQWLPPSVRTRLDAIVGAPVESFIGGFSERRVSRALFEAAIGAKRVECPMDTLAAVVRREHLHRIDLLKIDVEGAELEVLLGLGEEGWPVVRQIVLEGVDTGGRLAAISRLLRSRGFLAPNVESSKSSSNRGLGNFMLHARRPSWA